MFCGVMLWIFLEICSGNPPLMPSGSMGHSDDNTDTGFMDLLSFDIPINILSILRFYNSF